MLPKTYAFLQWDVPRLKTAYIICLLSPQVFCCCCSYVLSFWTQRCNGLSMPEHYTFSVPNPRFWEKRGDRSLAAAPHWWVKGILYMISGNYCFPKASCCQVAYSYRLKTDTWWNYTFIFLLISPKPQPHLFLRLISHCKLRRQQ